jgi:uncharacterized protein (TIGR02001 family)
VIYRIQKTIIFIILGLFLSPTYAEFVSNVALKSNYILRGITQTDRNPALQGGFDYSNDRGIYLGTWASNVNWVGSNSLEDDLYGGYKYKFSKSKDWLLDFGVIGYLYPGAIINVNYVEEYIALTYKFFTLKENYSSDFINVRTYSFYTEFNVSYPLNSKKLFLKGVSILGHVGTYTFGNEIKVGLDNYWDWAAGLKKDLIKDYSLELLYTANTLSNSFYPFNKSAFVIGLVYKMA